MMKLIGCSMLIINFLMYVYMCENNTCKGTKFLYFMVYLFLSALIVMAFT